MAFRTDQDTDSCVIIPAQCTGLFRALQRYGIRQTGSSSNRKTLGEFFGVQAGDDTIGLPVDEAQVTAVRQITATVNAVYVVDRENLDNTVSAHTGRHLIRAEKHLIVLEAAERKFLSPIDNCLLEVRPGTATVLPEKRTTFRVIEGLRKARFTPVQVSPGIENAFDCLSLLCSMPGESTVFRSHPLFRDRLPPISVTESHAGISAASTRSAITFHLPPEYRFLYAAAPLAYYLGAAVQGDGGSCIEAGSQTISLPDDPHEFEDRMGALLRRVFHMDCMVRHAIVDGNGVPPEMHPSCKALSPQKIMGLDPVERLQLYLADAGEARDCPLTWHMASYVDPVPASLEVMPYLLRTLSSVYTPGSVPISEREVVTMSIRQFTKTYCGRARGTAAPGHIVHPEFKPAMLHLWFSDGYPIDAFKASARALANKGLYASGQKMPPVGIVCNEDAMLPEARAICEALSDLTTVQLHMNLTPAELLRIFSRGYGIVQFIGHCDHRGLKCSGGFADLADVKDNNTPVFFFNSCASYEQGVRLIEKGSVCGITTLYRVIEEAALDVCSNFYRLLAHGYPLVTAYLGSRECSALGKEYLLMGDGFFPCFGNDQLLPLYLLNRASGGFDLRCIFSHLDRGFNVRSWSSDTIDTGYIKKGVPFSRLLTEYSDAAGLCVYNGTIYPSICSAITSAAYHSNIKP